MITASGSYRLTSNLYRSTPLFGSQNEHFIEITANDVSVDLGGFQILCTVLLAGSCSGSGAGVAAPTFHSGISVKNGSITGMGTDGVRVGAQSIVSDLRVHHNGQYGIYASFGSLVSGNTVFNNGSHGILAIKGSTVSGNTVHNNGDDGISVYDGVTVSGNSVYENEGNGIAAINGSNVSGNTVWRNGEFGLSLSTGVGYRENVLSGNTSGTVDAGVNTGGNLCDGSLTCP